MKNTKKKNRRGAKKAIVIGFFGVLIALTVISTFQIVSQARDEAHQKAMMGASGSEIGLGEGIAVVVGVIVVLCELDLFFTAYYFLAKPRTAAKSRAMLISHLMVLLVIFSGKINHFLFLYVSEIFREDFIFIFPLFFLYVISRLVCVAICYSEEG